jgi:hypothetical protein
MREQTPMWRGLLHFLRCAGYRESGYMTAWNSRDDVMRCAACGFVFSRPATPTRPEEGVGR